MTRKWWIAAALAVLCSCGGSPPPKEPAAGVPAQEKAKPVDETRRFPLADQVSMRLIDDHILGKDFLPGGNVAEYRRKGKTYQQFLVHTRSPDAAALLLFDFKNHLRAAKFLPHMGGYFGMDGTSPVYVFPKGAFLAGLVGLPEKDADLLARQFAARLD
ncbi:MAG TPA: hypothetical protein VMT32_07890 [Bryobacteraceae bacterium]|nr:hypothetical protein [Bryobacteraceae bacterium]